MEKTLEQEIAEVFKEIEAPKAEKEAVKEAEEDVKEAEEPNDTVSEEEPKERAEEAKPEPVNPNDQPPRGVSASVRAKWAQLDPEVKEDIIRREEDFHRKLTSSDSEYHFGKRVKDVVTPYMAVIQSEGGTPEKAIADLLNTAYVLRTAAPAQKAALVNQIITQYGVDMGLLQNTQQVDPQIHYLQNEIQQLRQQLNPELLKKQWQEESVRDNIEKEVNAFASDPANVYYHQVKPVMAALMDSGQARSLKEAYDMACRANPAIFSALQSAEKAKIEEKKKAEVEAKKKASASISGSPSQALGNSTYQKMSLEEELRSRLSDNDFI